MTTWNEFKKEVTILSSEEMELIDSLAFLVAKRLELGISQKELAKRTGMSQPRIAKIESVDSIPSLATLKRYASGIGYDTQVIFSSDTKKGNVNVEIDADIYEKITKYASQHGENPNTSVETLLKMALV